MKKNYVRTLTFFGFCVLLMTALTLCASAKTVKSGDFTFNVNGKTASLVEYTGSDATVKVPTTVNGATVTKIDNYAFWQNRKIVKVYLPSTATVIGEAAFNECTSLVKVVLPEKLVTLHDSVFWFCTNLKYVVFGPNVKNFGQNIFTGCNKAITAYVVKGTPAEKYISSQKTVRLGYRYITSLKAVSSLTLTVKASAKISVTVSPSIVYNSSLSFSSSDPKVAKVSSDGTVTALKCGKVTITCQALDGSKKSVKTTVSVVPAKTAFTSQSKTTLTGYRLNWKKADGATDYRVYRYDEQAKKWVKLADTKNTYLNVSGLSYYSSAMYRVRPFCRSGKNTYSGYVSATFTAKVICPGQVTAVSRVSSNTAAVTFSWKAPSYADGYYVYRYNFQTKKYTYLGLTTATKYTVKGLEPNTEYGFAVRAFMNDGKKRVIAQKHSGLFYISTTPLPVKNFSCTDDSLYFNKITVKWSKASGVTGYVLTYAPAGAAEKKLVLPADKTSAEVTGLNPGTSYTFRLRAYRSSRSVNYYSSYVTLTASTSYIPTTASEAVSSFVKAFNTTKDSKRNLSLIVRSGVTASESNPETELAEKTAEVFASRLPASVQYQFRNGKDPATGVSLASVLLPNASALTLGENDLDLNQVSFKTDGSGYRVGLVLENQSSQTDPAKLLAPTVNTDAVEKATGAKVISVTYDKTQVCEEYTKIQDSVFDYLKTVCTVTVTLNDGENDIPLTYSIERTYYFLWD